MKVAIFYIKTQIGMSDFDKYTFQSVIVEKQRVYVGIRSEVVEVADEREALGRAELRPGESLMNTHQVFPYVD